MENTKMTQREDLTIAIAEMEKSTLDNKADVTAKMTQREALTIAIAEMEKSTLDNKADVTAKLQSMIATLDKKKNGASGKAKEKADADKDRLAVIVTMLENEPEPITVGDLFTKHIENCTDNGITSSQHMRSLIKPAIADGRIVNTKEKGKSLFALAQ